MTKFEKRLADFERREAAARAAQVDSGNENALEVLAPAPRPTTGTHTHNHCSCGNWSGVGSECLYSRSEATERDEDAEIDWTHGEVIT